MEFEFGQLAGSSPPLTEPTFCAQTLLLSKELCQVALPKGSGVGALPLGAASLLRKCVMIWICWPKKVVNRVASGRALFEFHAAVVAPGAVGMQM